MKLSLVLLLFAITNAFAQTGTVRGHVRDDSGEEVLGAIVEILHAHGGVDIHTGAGYSIQSLPAGLDTLCVQAIGYYPITIPIEIRRDTVTIADFVLMAASLRPNPQLGSVPDYSSPPENYAQTHSKITYQAQTGKIKGRVTDLETGEGISVPVALVHAKRHVSSNPNGYYEIRDICVGLDTLLAAKWSEKMSKVPVIIRADSVITVNIKVDCSTLGIPTE